MSNFRGKVVLVTGGTSGIGRETAVAFAGQGARIVVTGRREIDGKETVALISKVGGEGLFLPGDVTHEDTVRGWVEQTVARYGRLDIAFNNAGVEILGPLVDFKTEDYRKVFDINVLGVFLSMKHEIPAMLKNGGGAIINTSSIAGHIGMANGSIYMASKHAVEGITRSAAVEYAKQNIRVNTVAPGAIQTEMIDRFAGNDDGKAYLASLHPMGRIGKAPEVAAAVLFLASDAASFVTGISLPVDGGFLAQ